MAEDVISSGVVENLVTQFSSALDCFRELVQNSIDAGSSRVDVWCEFMAGEGHMGTIAYHVDDFGEGMDEAIIDEQLTQLFASAKENDLTKIGKFGIGFVSVFALRPKAVLVLTGRGGEWWEVLFHEDRSFSKTRLELPVEGTQVTIFIEGDYHRYVELVEGVKATLSRWCAHSEIEVSFEDRSPPGGELPEPIDINEPFTVEGDCVTRLEVPGTEMVLAFNPKPIYGFYNRGLTLALSDVSEQVFSPERARRYSQISVKIKSRYLEHTLSRETVMRDENYEKAMNLLDTCADGDLLGKLVTELTDLVGRKSWALAEMSRYSRLCNFLRRQPEKNLERVASQPLLRGVQGELFSLIQAHEAYRHDGRILLAEHPTALTRQLAADKIPVILGRSPYVVVAQDGGEERLHPLDVVPRLIWTYVARREEAALWRQVKDFVLARLDLKGQDVSSEVWRALTVPERVYLNVALDQQVPPELAPMVRGAHSTLRSINAGFRKLRTFTPAAAVSEPPFFATARKLGRLMARPPRRVAERTRRLEAAVNRRHPYFQALLRLYPRSPGLAVYCLAKGLLLYEDRLLDRDLGLMEAAMALEGR
jgi:hypothetical protein